MRQAFKASVIVSLLIVSTAAVSVTPFLTFVGSAETPDTIYILADGTIDPATAPITTSDKTTYTLTGDISGTIVIERSDIVLDGSGYTVSSSGIERYGIYMNSVSGVTVKDMVVSGFDGSQFYQYYGIFVVHCPDCVFTGITFTSNDRGIYISQSNSVVKYCTGTYNEVTVYTIGSPDVEIDSCQFSLNKHGIIIGMNSYRARIIDCTLNSNTNTGLSILPGSDDCVVSGNTANNNYNGFFCEYADDCVFSDNTANSNEGANFYLQAYPFSGTTYRCILENNVATNAKYGIRTERCYGFILIDNEIKDNKYGLHLANSRYFTLTGNKISGSDVSFNVGAGYLNYVIYDTTIYYHDIDTTNTIDGKPIYYYYDTPALKWDFSDAGFIGLVKSGGTVKNAVMHNNSCGVLIIESPNVVVEDCSLYDNLGSGIIASFSDGCTFINNKIFSNYMGLDIQKSQYCTGQGNEIFNNLESGIYLRFTDNSVLMKNIVSNCGDQGIWLSNSNHLTMKENNVKGCKFNFAMQDTQYVDHDIDTSNLLDNRPMYYYVDVPIISKTDFSDASFIGFVRSSGTIDNAMISNTAPGILLYDADGTQVLDSEVKDTGSGVITVQSDDCRFVNNIVKDTLGTGMYIYQSERCILENNIIKACTNWGVRLISSPFGVMDSNVVIDCGYYGLSFASDCTFSNNVVMGCQGGASVGGSNCVISNNEIKNNVETGLTLYGSNHEVTSNTISHSASYGIYGGCSGSTFIDNNIMRNGRGIYLYSATDCVFDRNTVMMNDIEGFYLRSATSCQLSDNFIHRNLVGVCLDGPTDCSLESNTIQMGTQGIVVNLATSLSMQWNNIKSNIVGLAFSNTDPTASIEIYQNNFLRNDVPLIGDYYDDWSWDDGSGHGNYWSDYAGKDDGSGGGTAGDGIGDTLLPHLGVDYYPYMQQDGWVP